MNWHDVEISVPLSNLMLFDLHTKYLAKKLCDKFPGLNYKIDDVDNSIVFYGKLNDFWFANFDKVMFQIGSLDILEEDETDN